MAFQVAKQLKRIFAKDRRMAKRTKEAISRSIDEIVIIQENNAPSDLHGHVPQAAR
jgi:hypothetical protein